MNEVGGQGCERSRERSVLMATVAVSSSDRSGCGCPMQYPRHQQPSARAFSLLPSRARVCQWPCARSDCPVLAEMQQNLKDLLKSNAVAQDCVEWLEQAGCTTVKGFANWVESREEVQSLIVKAAVGGKYKDDRDQASKLKMAWREADGIVTGQLKRKAEGMQEEEASCTPSGAPTTGP